MNEIKILFTLLRCLISRATEKTPKRLKKECRCRPEIICHSGKLDATSAVHDNPKHKFQSSKQSQIRKRFAVTVNVRHVLGNFSILQKVGAWGVIESCVTRGC